jgi:hypothetical protein
MAQKNHKKLRRTIKKFNKQVFTDAVIEISAFKFFPRLWFCLKMAFLMHPLQDKHKDEIKARRKYTAEGKVKG